MKATVRTYRARISEPEIEELSAIPDLEWFKAKLDGGYLETVPGFDRITIDGERRRCVAFCDEEGKLKSLPFNRAATVLWDDALPNGLRTPIGAFIDVLCGPVVVIIGDDEFMAAL